MTTQEKTARIVPMPNLGENVTEGTVTRWLKAVGDHVDAEEPLLEVATDKVDTEIPAPFAGTLVEIVANENDVVEIGATLARIADSTPAPDSSPPAPLQENASAKNTPPQAAAPPQPPPHTPAPVHAAPRTTEVARPAPPPQATAAPTPRPAQQTSRVEKLPRIRQTIARRMVESLQTSAQLTTVLEVDVTAIARLRTANKTQFHQRTGVKLSFLPFFAKATIDALGLHPVLNASLNSDATEVTYHQPRHLGIAVDSEKGLVVPVIRNAHDLGIAGLAIAIADLASRVRSGKINADELSGGTFTLTNTGSRGALFDTPIINQPQTGILGTGAVVERVVPIRDPASGLRIGVQSMAYLSISYDHRIVDGADAARFLVTIKDRLENTFTAADLM